MMLNELILLYDYRMFCDYEIDLKVIIIIIIYYPIFTRESLLANIIIVVFL